MSLVTRIGWNNKTAGASVEFSCVGTWVEKSAISSTLNYLLTTAAAECRIRELQSQLTTFSIKESDGCARKKQVLFSIYLSFGRHVWRFCFPPLFPAASEVQQREKRVFQVSLLRRMVAFHRTSPVRKKRSKFTSDCCCRAR